MALSSSPLKKLSASSIFTTAFRCTVGILKSPSLPSITKSVAAPPLPSAPSILKSLSPPFANTGSKMFFLPFASSLQKSSFSTWGSSKVVEVFWYYDEVPIPIKTAIDAMIKGFQANGIKNPELYIQILFTTKEDDVKKLVEAEIKNLGGDIHITVGEKNRGGPKGVPNAMIAAIRLLRKQAEEAKKKKQVLLFLADPDFAFKGSINRLSKNNLVFLILTGDMEAKKELTKLSHHHWKWEELASGKNVEGTAKTQKK